MASSQARASWLRSPSRHEARRCPGGSGRPAETGCLVLLEDTERPGRETQGAATGDRDRGGRTAVTGGGHCAEFATLVREILVASGIPDNAIHDRRRTELPGYFRATKDWDLVAVLNGHLVAVVEFKSQVGSFGNNFNNRPKRRLATPRISGRPTAKAHSKAPPSHGLATSCCWRTRKHRYAPEGPTPNRTLRFSVSFTTLLTPIVTGYFASAWSGRGSTTPPASSFRRGRPARWGTIANPTASCPFGFLRRSSRPTPPPQWSLVVNRPGGGPHAPPPIVC